jgi:nicotinamidase-related amidase
MVKPQLIDVTLDPKTTAQLVLDLNVRCEDPKEICHKIIEPVAKFLKRARGAGVFIFYTVAPRFRGTPQEKMVAIFERHDDEPVHFSFCFDKFFGGELDGLLKARGVRTLIIAGALSNVAVLYTATTAVRPLGYDVVIPVDGLAAPSDYEQEYTLHQLATLPGGAAEKIRFSEFDRIGFS